MVLTSEGEPEAQTEHPLPMILAAPLRRRAPPPGSLLSSSSTLRVLQQVPSPLSFAAFLASYGGGYGEGEAGVRRRGLTGVFGDGRRG